MATAQTPTKNVLSRFSVVGLRSSGGTPVKSAIALLSRVRTRLLKPLAHRFANLFSVGTVACPSVRECHLTANTVRRVEQLVPETKQDLATAKRAVKAGWPAVAPIAPLLLEWLQDGNWPVAGVLAPFFASVGTPLVPYLRPILRGDDAMWKYWIITLVLGATSREMIEELRPELEKLGAHPSRSEDEDVVREAATEALARLRRT